LFTATSYFLPVPSALYGPTLFKFHEGQLLRINPSLRIAPQHHRLDFPSMDFFLLAHAVQFLSNFWGYALQLQQTFYSV
jgi:hypothetical protein